MDPALRNDLMRRVIDARHRKDRAEEARKAAGRELRELEDQLFDALEEAHEPSVKVDLGPGYGTRRFVRRETHYGQVLDLQRAREALLALGYDEAAIVGEKLREKPLNELVREALDHNQDLPEGVGFYTRRGVTISSR